MYQSTAQLKIFEIFSTDPYRNIAIESYFLKHIGENEVILYLWSNERTVVIGRNQNIWRECNVETLLADGGHPVRRLSGGGAVYHDSGNLNVTFITKKALYDRSRQTEVILDAARALGFDAEHTGRNDLCIGGRKFSGHSFHHDADRYFHNGTVLIRTDAEAMRRYLTPSREKLESKSVTSVKSRTVNLSELSPAISVSEVRGAIKNSFGRIYGGTPEMLDDSFFDPEDLADIETRFRAEDWTYNTAATFKDGWRRRYDWGEVDLQLKVSSGTITDCIVYTDALDTGIPERIKARIIGSRYSPAGIEGALDGLLTETHNR